MWPFQTTIGIDSSVYHFVPEPAAALLGLCALMTVIALDGWRRLAGHLGMGAR